MIIKAQNTKKRNISINKPIKIIITPILNDKINNNIHIIAINAQNNAHSKTIFISLSIVIFYW